MPEVKVRCGWIHREKAGIPGMHIGPKSLIAIGKQGPLHVGHHNLLTKDVVFQAKGKHALGAILKHMMTMQTVRIRNGIFKGMVGEEFVADQYSPGSWDQVTRAITKTEDQTRIEWYMYVNEMTESEYSFNKVMFSVVVQVAGIVGAGLHGALVQTAAPGSIERTTQDMIGQIKDLADAGKAYYDMGVANAESGPSLGKLAGAKCVQLVLTSRQRSAGTLVKTYLHTHTPVELASEVLLQLAGPGATLD